MTGFVDGVTKSEDLVIDYREVIVAHQDVIRRVVPFVAVRQVAVALLVDVAVAGYKQVSSGAEDGPYAVNERENQIESRQASNCSLCKGKRALTRGGSTPRTTFSRHRTWLAVRPGCSSAWTGTSSPTRCIVPWSWSCPTGRRWSHRISRRVHPMSRQVKA